MLSKLRQAAGSPKSKKEEEPRPSSASEHDTVLDERRKFLGGNDGEGDQEDRAPEDIPPKDLIQRAKVHMRATACTKWDDKEHCYKFLPVWGTGRRELGVLGFGVQLYFQFLCQMGWIFILLTILTGPLLAANLHGDIVQSEGTQHYFGILSVANLGICGTSGVDCSTTEQTENRLAGIKFDLDLGGVIRLDSETKVNELTPVFGTLDGVGLLLFMCFGVFFNKWWIPREQKRHDNKHITPGDFTLRIRHLPRKLSDEEHPNYKQLLQEHFTKILKKCGVQDEDPVHEVTLVREYHGAIEDYMVQGQYVLQKKDLQVRMKKAETDAKRESLQKQVDSLNKKILKMEKSFGKNAGKVEQEREVCNEAFVVFNREAYVDKVLHEYRYARSRIFRCCMSQELKFKEHSILVEQAREPSDLFWENMDFGKWKRRTRVGLTCLMTLVILIICLIALLMCKMINVTTEGGAPDVDLWVVKNPNPTCLTMCEWQLFSDSACRVQDGVDSGSIEAYWDGSGNYSAGSFSPCQTDTWSSSLCTGNGGTAGQPQWLGIQLSASSSPGCLKFHQRMADSVAGAEVFGCSADSVIGLNSTALASWDPAEHCIAMQNIAPAQKETGGFAFSGQQLVLLDGSCSRTVSIEAAQKGLDAKIAELKETFPDITDDHALYRASTEDNTMHCFCKQQQKAAGITKFRAPPYDATPEKQLCKEWINFQNRQLIMMAAGVLAVTVLNLVLVLVFTYFVVWERHSTFTEQNSSQFLKLLVAQFMNTALIVLVVNANFGKIKEWPILKMLQVGNGTYTDLNGGWFVAVGSGLCLTIALQVISATTPGVIMSYIVNPVMIWFFKRGLATQKVINQVFVYPEWSLANRLAQTLTVVFVIMMYSGGMPILNPIGALYCLFAYWLDKWCLLRGSLKPPQYNGTLMKISANLFPFAAFLHAIVTLWCFGNQTVFPSKWSVLQSFFGQLIGVDADTDYQTVIDEFRTASEKTRDDKFYPYVGARALDMARWSCWLLLCIFLVFCVYYIIGLIHALFLRPVLAPFVIACSGYFSKGVQGRAEESTSFKETHKEMMDNGHLITYDMHGNPRYGPMLEHLHNGNTEVEVARNELSEREAKKPPKTDAPPVGSV